jgi:hypothetical protein
VVIIVVTVTVVFVILVVTVTVAVTVEIYSGLILSYEKKFVRLGQDITNILEVYRLNTVFMFSMSLLVCSGATV